MVNKIEFFEGTNFGGALKLIGISRGDVLAISVVFKAKLADFYEEYSLANGTLVNDPNDNTVWKWTIDDQASRKKHGEGSWQVAIKTAALGWRKSGVFGYKILPATNLQPSGAAAASSLTNQIFNVSISTAVVVEDAFLMNLLKGDNGPSAYEVAVQNGFEGNAAEWLDSFAVPKQQALDAAAVATTKAGEANQSAINAASSATTANTKAGEASTSATNAAISAATANTKAGEANTSATNAAASAATANTKAEEANQSAINAAASAQTAQNTLKERWHTFQASHSYVAIAPLGSLASQAVWTVTRITVDAAGSTTKSYAYNAIRNNYLTLTYS